MTLADVSRLGFDLVVFLVRMLNWVEVQNIPGVFSAMHIARALCPRNDDPIGFRYDV